MQRNIWWASVNSKELHFLTPNTSIHSAKLTPLKEKARFHYALFSENGFDEKVLSDVAANEVLLFSLGQIVNYI